MKEKGAQGAVLFVIARVAPSIFLGQIFFRGIYIFGVIFFTKYYILGHKSGEDVFLGFPKCDSTFVATLYLKFPFPNPFNFI